MNLTEENFRRFISLAKKILWDSPEWRRRLESHGVSLTPARFYNEIPLMEDIEEGFETKERFPYLFDFLDNDTLYSTIESLIPYADEFNPPSDDLGSGFYWNNPSFSFSDAMAYYAFIRSTAPNTVVEIGSGYSTMVAIEASQKNQNTSIICYDPFPQDFIKSNTFISIAERKAQDISPEELNDILDDGDILFIDSTHTVKMSSDCAHIYLRLLPNIRKNIYVHVHDIRLPRGLDSRKAKNQHIYWTEQHILSALLIDNPRVTCLFGSRWALDFTPESLERLMQGKYRPGGSSFWFKYSGNS